MITLTELMGAKVVGFDPSHIGDDEAQMIELQLKDGRVIELFCKDTYVMTWHDIAPEA